MKLRSYDKKYALNPVSQIRAMVAYAAPEVERVRQREAYLRRPQNPQVFETPLRLPSKAEVAASATVMSRGESLASLGPRLKQIGFLANMGLYPPDDELDLDAWVANRLRELRFRGPSTLANWMKIGPTAREAALNNETQMIEDAQKSRTRTDDTNAYLLENDEFANTQLFAIEPEAPVTRKKKKRVKETLDELGAIDIDAPEPKVKIQEVRGGSLRKAALAARLAVLEQANIGRRKPMGLPELPQANLVEEADDPPVILNQPRVLPPPFEEIN